MNNTEMVGGGTPLQVVWLQVQYRLKALTVFRCRCGKWRYLAPPLYSTRCQQRKCRTEVKRRINWGSVRYLAFGWILQLVNLWQANRYRRSERTQKRSMNKLLHKAIAWYIRRFQRGMLYIEGDNNFVALMTATQYYNYQRELREQCGNQ